MHCTVCNYKWELVLSHEMLILTQRMKPEFRLEIELECHSYILCYVDEIICIHHDPDDVLIKLNCYVSVKPSSINSSDVDLCTNAMHMQV